MFIECVLIVASLCQAVRDRPVMALTSISTAALVADGVTTSRIIGTHNWTALAPIPCSVNGAPVFCGSYLQQWTITRHEEDPVSRLLIGRYPTWKRMVPVGIGLIVGEMWLAERMKRSHTWVRHVWWIPQVLTIGANTTFATLNSRLRVN
jgi:hypothetical protein